MSQGLTSAVRVRSSWSGEQRAPSALWAGAIHEIHRIRPSLSRRRKPHMEATYGNRWFLRISQLGCVFTAPRVLPCVSRSIFISASAAIPRTDFGEISLEKTVKKNEIFFQQKHIGSAGRLRVRAGRRGRADAPGGQGWGSRGLLAMDGLCCLGFQVLDAGMLRGDVCSFRILIILYLMLDKALP